MRIHVSVFSKLARRLDGKGYGGYRELRNLIIDYDKFVLRITKVQGDPHAPPSYCEVYVHSRILGIPENVIKKENLVPLTDFVYRTLYSVLKRYNQKCGSGNSCYLGVPKPGPYIIRRSGVEYSDKEFILRFFVGLPAKGRRINGRELERIFVDKVPRIISDLASLLSDTDSLPKHIEVYKDYMYIRVLLDKWGATAFIANNSVLPRKSSISHEPLPTAIPFRSPKELEIEITLPSGKKIKGMLIPRGLTTITGAGYHGKTTLLNAIQNGIYPHIIGDGREYVVSRNRTVTVKAEDGRMIHCVDLSSFIHNLPNKEDTTCFNTRNASGSTSMAASINEAIEAGAEVILVDEDTSATNLLYKDKIVSEIIREDTISTLSQQARSMVEKTGVNLVIVASASSVFFGISDKIVLMEKYIPRVIRIERNIEYYHAPFKQYKEPRKRFYYGIKGLKKIKASSFKLVAQYSDGTIFELDVRNNPRIVEKSQVRLLAKIIKKFANPSKPLTITEIIEKINRLLEERGFEAFAKPVPPDLAYVDGFDVVWVLNRLYNASFKQE